VERIIDTTIACEQFFVEGALRKQIASSCGIKPQNLHYKILRKSIDARKRPTLCLKVLISDKPIEKTPVKRNYQDVSNAERIIVVGAGPCGLFAALKLIEEGFKPIIIERGKHVSERKKDIAIIARNQELNEESNWCFGEGGAGTFSDGKLYTRSTKKGNINDILETFVYHGADENILVESHPHIGTDKLSRIIKNIRETILKCGGEYHFNTKVTDFLIKNNTIYGIKTSDNTSIEAKAVILATGHSARDIYYLFAERGWAIEAKPFAMGVRVEHSQELINTSQYHNKELASLLPPASYSLVHNVKNRGVFSFCMCPGGMIIPASTEKQTLVVNGMSASNRASAFANSGIVVSVTLQDVKEYSKQPALSLMKFQQECEQKMYIQNQVAPAQRISDFIKNKKSHNIGSTSYPSGLYACNMNEYLPKLVAENLAEGFKVFDRRIKGFISNQATMIGLESRTSSPVRILRDKESLQHPQISMLFPCGEGAGYAGGITSSAIDGVNAAEKISQILK
jgi:uncharacterized FAD-dependent dehydrogenase